MLIKWIRCRVVDPEAFGEAQRAWGRLRGLPGFLGQGGGWSRQEPGTAHIFGCWAGRPHYEAFMAEQHDRIADAQAGSYRAIVVRLFDHRLDIGARLPAGFTGASPARLAHCAARTGAGAWNARTTAGAGLRGGVFAQRGESEFLALTLWGPEAGHGHHLDGGHLIDLESAWAVAGIPGRSGSRS